MKRSVGNITLLFLGIFLKAQVGCLAMPEPNVNVNVDVNIKERNGKPNGCSGLCSWVWNPICTSYKQFYKSFSNMDCFQTAKESDPTFKEYEWKYDGLCAREFRCLGDAVAFGSQCLTFKYWSQAEHKNYKNWHEANNSCNSMCGRLATLKHPNETYNYVTKIGGPFLWAGGNDIDNEGSWVWTDNQPFSATFPWKPEETGVNTNDNCLIIDDGYGYATRHCDSIRLPFICEDILSVELEVGSIQSDSIDINWVVSNHIKCTISKYTVQYGGQEDEFGAEVTSHKITGLTCGTGYIICVMAHPSEGDTSISNIRNITTLGCN